MSAAPPPPPPGYDQASGYSTVNPPPGPATQPAPAFTPPPQPYGTGYQTGYPPQPAAGYPPQPAAGYPPQPATGYPPQPTGYPQQPPTSYTNPNATGFSNPQAAGAYGAPQADPYGGGPKTSAGYSPARQTYTTVGVPDEGTAPANTHIFADDGGFAGASFSDKAIRRLFIRKVYMILMLQLLVTVGFISFFLFHEPTKLWVRTHTWFYWCSYAVFLVSYITLVCCPGVRRTWPANFVCLAIFTLAFSYMTATISSMYDTKIVLIAAGITTAVCLAISIFAIQTKIDFTMCTGLIFALCMVVFFFGISCMIVYMVWGPNYILQCVYGALAALLFSLFLAYDTQMLMGGRKHELSPEEYIFASLQLYMDIVYMFLIILSFFGKS